MTILVVSRYYYLSIEKEIKQHKGEIMKKLLYSTTILFNAIGTIISIILTLVIGAQYNNFLPIIFIGCIFFIISLSVSALEYTKNNNNNIIYLHKYQKPIIKIASKGRILDYKDYFAKKKGDFIIAG